MELIINERAELLNRIEANNVEGIYISKMIFPICKYIAPKYDNWKDMEEEFNEIMTTFYGEDYTLYALKNIVNIRKTFKKVHENGYILNDRDFLGVTQGELDTISKYSMKERKVLFTLIVLARYNKSDWVTQSYSEIFTLSSVILNKTEQCLLLKKFIDEGLLERAKKIGNLNLRVTFLDEDEPKIKIYRMLNIGGQYVVNFDSRYVLCKECFKTVKKTNNKIKYCKSCSISNNIRKTKENKNYLK